MYCAGYLDHLPFPGYPSTKHYIWATMFQFLSAKVATKALKTVCSTGFLVSYGGGHFVTVVGSNCFAK